MLIDGELDAAIYGAAMPNDPRLQSVIPDPDAAARAWYAKHGMVPVNHMVVVTDELVARQIHGRSPSFTVCWKRASRRRGARAPSTPRRSAKQANRPCLDLLISYAVQQQLIPRRIEVRELF